MDKCYQVMPDIEVLPANFPIPGMGFLPVNAFVIQAKEPILTKWLFNSEIIAGKGQGTGPPALHPLKSLLPPC